MSELPPTWTSTTLGLVSQITTGNTPSTKIANYFGGSHPFVKPGDLDRRLPIVETVQTLSDTGATNARLVRPGAVLVSCIGKLGKIGIAGKPLATNQQINAVEFHATMIDDRYGYYYCCTLKTWMEQSSSATTVAILNKGRFSLAPIAVAPLAEQIRIANQLDTLLTRVQACNDRFDAIPALLKRFRQTVLDAATTGGLTDDWCDQSAKPWGHVQLREVASAFSYGSAAKSSKSGDVPVLRMGNIQRGRLDWSDLVFTSDKKEIEKYKLDKGDVLFNRTNSPELVGKTAVFQGEREAVYAGYLIRVRCLPKLLPEYLNYCLGSKAGREYCWSVKSDGVSQSNINAKKLAAFSFLLPEYSEQTEIVRRVEALFALADRIEARCTAARTHAQRLTPLVLAKAFRGELVPQDPNDEPASVLLARIASSNTAVAGKNTRKVPVALKERAQTAINL